MVNVDSLRFGSIVINGKKFRHDVTLSPDGTVKRRNGGFWMFGGHSIKEEEVSQIVNEGASSMVIGTGTSGVAKLTKEALSFIDKNKIEMVSLPSKEAIIQFNKLTEEGKKVGAIIHVTC
ncbi:MAG: MTH938/NDUFAF3 family protein [Thermodesulfobacteriota bacterium]|nr:MTH938/NDUFAF3 family protein [Thermodesulfobacteriota bacterium]